MLLKEAMQIWRDYALLEEISEINLAEQNNININDLIDNGIERQWATRNFGEIGGRSLTDILKSRDKAQRQKIFKELVNSQKEYLKFWIKRLKKEIETQKQAQQGSESPEQLTGKLEQEMEKEEKKSDAIEQKKEQAEEQNNDSLAEKYKQFQTKIAQESVDKFMESWTNYFNMYKQSGKNAEEARDKLKSVLNNDGSIYYNAMAAGIDRAFEEAMKGN